jgi:hypothetical protein
MFGNVIDEVVGDFRRGLGAAEVGSGDVIVEGGFYGLL